MNSARSATKTIGILALQGDFEAHRRVLEDRLGARTEAVRLPSDLAKVDALVLPGGESTTIAKLLARVDLLEPVRERARAGLPIYGTCAGMILMASSVEERPDQPTLGIMDIAVARNAFGRQVDSFEADLTFTASGAKESVRGVFIRAPFVARVGEGVEIVAEYRGRIVGVRQGRMLATAFHPELTDSLAVHRYFMTLVEQD